MRLREELPPNWWWEIASGALFGFILTSVYEERHSLIAAFAAWWHHALAMWGQS